MWVVPTLLPLNPTRTTRVAAAGGGVALERLPRAGGSVRLSLRQDWGESSFEEVGAWEGSGSPPSPLGGREITLAGRAQPLADLSGVGSRRAGPGAGPPSSRAVLVSTPQPGGEGRAPHSFLLRLSRVACGLFSQLASVALQTRECLW